MKNIGRIKSNLPNFLGKLKKEGTKSKDSYTPEGKRSVGRLNIL